MDKKDKKKFLIIAYSSSIVFLILIILGVILNEGLMKPGKATYFDDSDNDGLNDEDETSLGLDPYNADTDGDLLSDGSEVIFYKTNPLVKDTDEDGIIDGKEVEGGSNPLIS